MGARARIRKVMGDNDNKFSNPFVYCSSLTALPCLVHSMILDYLNYSDKKNLRVTCKYFNWFINREFAFFPILSDETANAVVHRTFSCNYIQVYDLVMPRSLAPMMGTAFSEIEEIFFFRKASSQDYISKLNFIRVLRHCTMLVRLEIVGSILASFQITDKKFYNRIHLHNLRNFKLEFTESGGRYLAIEALQSANFPRLEEFILIIMPGEQQKLTSYEYEGITGMLVNSHATFRHLHIYDYGYVLCGGQRINIFASPLLPPPVQNIEKIQLMSLEIVDAYDDPEDRVPLQWPSLETIIKNQYILDRLQLVFPSAYLQPMISTAVTQCHHTLSTFFFMNTYTWDGFNNHFMMPKQYDCKDLRQCSNLKRFRIHSEIAVDNIDQLPNSLEELYWDSPIGRFEVRHFELNMTNLQTLCFGITAGYIQTSYIIRTLHLPALKILVVSICDRVEVCNVVHEWFRGVSVIGWPFSPIIGVRMLKNRERFSCRLPSYNNLDSILAA